VEISQSATLVSGVFGRPENINTHDCRLNRFCSFPKPFEYMPLESLLLKINEQMRFFFCSRAAETPQ